MRRKVEERLSQINFMGRKVKMWMRGFVWGRMKAAFVS